MHRSNTTLTDAQVNQPLIIRTVHTDGVPVEWGRWLEDIGFIAGENAMVLRRSLIPNGALVVRVGLSTFALHQQEAACVEVTAVNY